MKLFEERLARLIQQNDWFRATDKLLVAVSGGVDSMVLCHLLYRLGFDFDLAHVNYHLRGSDSDDDQAIVQNWASKHNKHIHIMTVDPEKDLNRKGDSLQMAARDIRYEWMENLLIQLNSRFIVTAHHANDSAETSLVNLIRGTGVKGLRGILPLSGNRVRPLIFFTKEEIYGYARAQNIEWREDRSNATDDYRRNFIRHQIIPKIEKINSAFIRNFQLTQKRLAALEQMLDDKAEEIKKLHIKKVNEIYQIQMDWWDNRSYDVAILQEILRPFGFTYTETLSLGRLIHLKSGKQITNTKGYRAWVDRSQLIVSPTDIKQVSEFEITQETKKISLGSLELVVNIVPREEIRVDPNPAIAFLDAGKLHFPLKVRRWKHGDTMKPLGMNQFKKVSDILIDRKVSQWSKLSTFVIESQGQICWLVNHRVDDRFKLDSKTQRVWVGTLQIDEQADAEYIM